MKILIIGGGGREHAIAQKLSQNTRVKALFVAPGNAGTALIAKNIALKNSSQILEFALENKIDLTVVGPEQFLVDGIVDDFNKNGLTILGPGRQAAQLEGSKVYAKSFMNQYGVKTAGHQSFSVFQEALEYIKTIAFPSVIKADGLAAGKGVVIVNNQAEAKLALDDMMQQSAFGKSGEKVVIEDYIEGFETSIIALYNGTTIYPMLPVQDHKPIGENNTGANTGGMGVIAPDIKFTPELMEVFIHDILLPTQKGLEKEKLNYKGVIFFGLKCHGDNVYLLEYNVRFGDPETQALLNLLENDLLSLLYDCLFSKPITLKWKDAYACCLVASAAGYPGKYNSGHEILGLENINCPYCLAGVKKQQSHFLTSGGRVLNIIGIGDSLQTAQSISYKNMAKVNFQGMYYRKDIGNQI